jgi:predicted regulator of Ras-like GTPase activity (Roadblock/LC7/MglB family)
MTISLERILAQLPSGSVRISFGSLRQAAPQLFSIGAESDGRDVALPLDEILSRINPAMICPPQHQIARGPIEEPPALSADTFTPTAPARSSTLSIPPKQSEPDKIPDLFFDARKGETPKLNDEEEEAPFQRHSTSLPPQTAALEPAAAAPAASTSVAQAPALQPMQPEPAQDAAVMRIPLKDLTELWPQELRSEIATLDPSHMVALPSEAINAGLKQGKVVFAWGTLRSWITPELPSVAFRDDKATLELPLPVIMPLFLAGRKEPSRPQLQVLDDDIPDPFADFIQPPAAAQKNGNAESEPARKEKPARKGKAARKEKAPDAKTFARQAQPASPKTQAKVEPQAELAPAAPKQSSTPAEVLDSALKIEGIAGALVALADGFKVAGKLPAGLDGDAVAAFLPHIFSKVNQSTRELRMGELDNLNFTVDNVPWKIFRVNQIFFAALGTAGQQMPTDQLAALAHQLTFKN